MKTFKSLLIVSLLLMIASPSSAQLGFKVGGNLATLTGDDAKEKLSLDGLFVGGFAGIYWKIGPNMVYLEPGLYYSQKGYRPDILGTTSNIGFGYLELPVLLNVKLPVGLGFYAGPGIGYIINVSADGVNVPLDQTVYYEFDVNAMGGIKWHLPFGLNFGIGFSKGIVEVLDPHTNFAIQAFAGFTLPGGK